MQWLAENWIFLLIVVGMVAMHAFGHGGHGGRRDGEDKDKDKTGTHRH